MKTCLFAIVLYFCSIQMFYSQEDDGVVSLALPVRNSLKFNQFVINPTFSFVREQNKYVSIYNKREWVQFEDAPQTYLVSYSGRFRENIGIGVGLFQQNYGVLTTFGGILNFAYNARLERESNLTFGMNVGVYKSGINNSNVVANFSDPSLENIPSNLLLSVSPGINYGTAFLDFGVSVNNLVLYNFETSELIQDNPQQSIQAHMMYTGYMSSRGFFDESKFTGLIKSEFGKDKTIVSGTAMLTVPKGIWAQVGYNSLYGVSGGLGLNITNQISIEYSFEKAIGDLTDFGPSHEITLAYKFKNKEHYDYSREDEISALISTDKKRKPVSKISKVDAEVNRKLSNEAKAQAKLDAENKAKAEAEALAKQDEENKLKAAAAAKAKEEAEIIAKAEAEAKAKQDAENKAKEEKAAKAKAEAQAKIRAENKARAEAQAKLEAENQAKAAVEAQAKLEAENKAKEVAEAQAKIEAENKAKAEAEAQAKLEAENKAKAEAEALAQIEADNKAKAEAQAKFDAELAAKEDLIKNPTDEIGKSLSALTKLTEDSEATQKELLEKLSQAVETKDKDLKDLKEENDLSEKGIYMEPKPFKSLTAENNALEALKVDVDDVIKIRSERIKELEDLYEQRVRIATLKNDEVSLYYKKTIERLKAEQVKAIQTKTRLVTSLEDIKIATEIERKRRIKRALYDSEEDRHFQDKAALKVIKQNTPLSNVPLKEEDFDFGEEQSSNIQILKNIDHAENGYYLIIAVHDDVAKRDEFLTKIVASGRKDVDFFYDVKTSKYFIYYQKVDYIEEANEAIKAKGNRPYNGKMSIVKIEN